MATSSTPGPIACSSVWLMTRFSSSSLFCNSSCSLANSNSLFNWTISAFSVSGGTSSLLGAGARSLLRGSLTGEMAAGLDGSTAWTSCSLLSVDIVAASPGSLMFFAWPSFSLANSASMVVSSMSLLAASCSTFVF